MEIREARTWQYVSVHSLNSETVLIEKITQSQWWTRACTFTDSHYHFSSGVMLCDHLKAVTENVDKIFAATKNRFLANLFALVKKLNIDKEKMKRELRVISLLHDIGKTEFDKSQHVPHPLHGNLTLKRHSIVGVYAAIEILDTDHFFSLEEKIKIYSVIEDHDISYGFFREWKENGCTPGFERWKKLNDKIDDKDGAGLLYLLIFKLADIHGHDNIDDVLWFFKTVKKEYFNKIGLRLPVPQESDIR